VGYRPDLGRLGAERSVREIIGHLSVGLLGLSLVFGGIEAITIAVVPLEFCALPILALVAWTLYKTGLPRDLRIPAALACLVAIVPLLQLIPIAHSLWILLPGREAADLATQLAQVTPDWLPASLTPDMTWRSFLVLLPPLGVFFGALACSGNHRRRMVMVVLLAVGANALLGATQLGDKSVGGLFGNPNHLATLLVMALPLAAAYFLPIERSPTKDPRVSMVWIGLFVMVTLVALGVVRSRFGIILAVPAAASSVTLIWLARQRKDRGRGVIALALLVAASVGAVALFQSSPILTTFEETDLFATRRDGWETTISAARTYLPIGSGVGSFTAVYAGFEPVDQVQESVLNHAHNDYAELWLETGLVGAIGIALFLAWWAWQSARAWLSPAINRATLFAQAAALSCGFALLHSIVDYPLRTEAISTVFALCCALVSLRTVSRAEEAGSR